ncbi:hypothetical protein OIU84_007256 [Salix udensis]|uniref:Uncharacterized protein n=1 Tax=Salix udensis TaxID=889485 RepID=A0AAD6NZD0_9ROSI|nr:hypothetical protein OIU84_007256 [Salix udensis]KAJ6410472.1 hypothetical protein OIU84_007256 [Salix udensis]
MKNWSAVLVCKVQLPSSFNHKWITVAEMPCIFGTKSHIFLYINFCILNTLNTMELLSCPSFDVCINDVLLHSERFVYLKLVQFASSGVL